MRNITVTPLSSLVKLFDVGLENTAVLKMKPVLHPSRATRVTTDMLSPGKRSCRTKAYCQKKKTAGRFETQKNDFSALSNDVHLCVP